MKQQQMQQKQKQKQKPKTKVQRMRQRMRQQMQKQRQRTKPTNSKKIVTRRPSFPSVVLDELFKAPRSRERWQVICGDKRHYRIGLYSPEVAAVGEIREFERHSCDEFFILLKGQVSLALMTETKGKQKIRVVRLKPLQPVLVRTWHSGFCPQGAFKGLALVVERDEFTTWMKRNRA